MKHRKMHLLDLPDELLLIIMEKLKHNDVLYSLLGVNKRIDRIVCNINNIYEINFTSISNGEHVCIDNEVLDRFCVDIMPRICHNVRILILDHWSMERVLPASEYPFLRSITFSCFQPDIVINCLKDESSIARLFKKQIEIIHVANTKYQTSNELFTDACMRIFELCTNLIEFDVGRVQSRLLIYNRISTACLASNLSVLSVFVANFDDCLCLLDGCLKQLYSFSVRIDFVDEKPSVIDNMKLLPNLIVFSLTGDNILGLGYDQKILQLLHRMPNLKELTLYLTITRLRFIDGIHLDKEILNYLLQLTEFIFHIRTIMPLLYSHDHLLVDDIRNTFNHWKYGEVNCYVDYFSNEAGQCHIYSVPFQMTRINGVTNSFFGNSFYLVVDIRLFDIHPFEHIYFKWIARAFPLLKKLTIDNMTSPENKDAFEIMNNNENSIISFPQLKIVTLNNAHIIYIKQFLCHMNSHLPCFSSLEINYETLITVTNNFTSDLTRINCAQLKKLIIGEDILYPKHFYLYFPFL